MKSLWPEYLQEQFGENTVSLEYSWGFVNYSFPAYAPNCIELEDIYVVPEQRRKGRGTELFKKVCKAGIEAGKDALLTQVQIESKVCVSSLLAQLSVGLIPISAQNDTILLRRSLNG